jgi:hypothetical protein
VGRCTASKSRRHESLRQHLKPMQWPLRRQRATAGAADAVTVRAHDVSPPRGGLIHISMAPQRQMHCNIAPVAWLLCSWTASVGKRNASICCGCLDRSVGGGRSSHGAVVCLRGFLRRENPYLCLYYVLLGCKKGCTKSQFSAKLLHLYNLFCIFVSLCGRFVRGGTVTS